MSDIIIGDEQPRRVYTVGATPQSSFAAPFPFLAAEDVHVIVNEGQADRELALGADYTVTGAGAQSGTVTLVTPVKNCSVTVFRSLKLERSTAFPAAGTLKIPALNREFNRFMMINQQQQERIDRSLKLASSDDLDTNATLPVAQQRAGRLFAFDAAGKPVMSDATVAQIEGATVGSYLAGQSVGDVTGYVGDGVTTRFDTGHNLVSKSSVLVVVGGVKQAPAAYSIDVTFVVLADPAPEGVPVDIRVVGVEVAVADASGSLVTPSDTGEEAPLAGVLGAKLNKDGDGSAVTVAGRSLDDLFSVEADIVSFGARSDLLFDSRPAALDAIAYLQSKGGGVLKIPDGSFRFNGPLNITGCPIRFKGAGMDLSQCYWFGDGPTDGIVFSTAEQLAAKGVVSLDIEDVRLTSVGQCGTAVRGSWPSATDSRTYLRLTRVAIDTVPLHQSWTRAFHFTNVNGVRMEDVRVRGAVADATQPFPYSLNEAFLFDETDAAFGKINHHIKGIYVENANYAFVVNGWYEGWYIGKGELAFVGDGITVEGSAYARNPAFTVEGMHVNARRTCFGFKYVNAVKLANIVAWRHGGAVGTARQGGNVIALEDCNHASITGSTLDSTVGPDLPGNGVILSGLCDTVQIAATSINGHTDAGIAAAGTITRMRVDAVVTNCGKAVDLGPATFDNIISYTGSGNADPDTVAGANNRINDIILATGGTAKREIADSIFAVGRQTAVAGSKMQVDNLLERGAQKVEDIGGIWSGKTFSHVAFSKTFDSTTAGGTSSGSPVATSFTYAVNDGCPADVAAGIDVAVAKTSNSTVFGRNVIVGNATGSTNTKLVGMEIDVQPTSGTTVNSGTGALYINAFNLAGLGPALQVGGVGGGSFTNGIVLGGGVSGAGFSGASGASMASLINTGGATYSAAAIVLSNGHKLRMSGTSASHAYSYNDGSDNRREVLGSGGYIWRNNADTVSLVSIDSGGNLNLEAGGELRSAGTAVVDTNRLICLRSYTVATLPSASVAGKEIYVSNESGGAVPAFSDGTNWRRVTDRAIVS